MRPAGSGAYRAADQHAGRPLDFPRCLNGRLELYKETLMNVEQKSGHHMQQLGGPGRSSRASFVEDLGANS
jgi:hypothetical protein